METKLLTETACEIPSTMCCLSSNAEQQTKQKKMTG